MQEGQVKEIQPINIENTIEEQQTEQQNEIKEEQEKESQNEIKEEQEIDKQSEIKEEQKIESQNEIKEEQELEEQGEIEEDTKNVIEELYIEKSKTLDEQIADELSKKGETITYKEFDEMYAKIFGKQPISKVEEESTSYKIDVPVTTGEPISVFKAKEKEEEPIYKFVGIAFSTYIIIEIDKELYLIDQHAAHERVLYEKVKENYYSDNKKESQLMLLPDVITLTHKEMEIAKENIEIFRKAGFELEEFGENTIKLTGVPNICLDLNTKELFLETLDEINTVARTAKQEIEDKFIATIACKAAVKANMVLTQIEVENLINELLKLENPFTCPHGRPTAIKMTKTDLEKKFSRR